MTQIARAPTSRPRWWWRAGVGAIVLLTAAELIARATGIGTRCPNLHVAPALWACDPVLALRMRSDLAPNGVPLNAAGFRTHPFAPKAPGTYRVLALGDSCTLGMAALEQFTWIAEPYPQGLERRAAEHPGARRVEVLNAGQAGYTTQQGVLLLRGKLRGLQPDLVTVRFGWNDQFDVSASDGALPLRLTANPIVEAVEDLVLPMALFGVARRLPLEVAARLSPAVPRTLPTVLTPSVSLADYGANLERIVARSRAMGAEVWLLTSPHAFLSAENRGRYAEVPDTMTGRQLLAFNAVPSFERLIEIHETYNAMTREVGAALGVPVIDMEAYYRASSHAGLFALTDVVHPAEAGHALEAEVLLARMEDAGIVARAPGNLRTPYR